jgi:DNA repair protein RadC
MPSQKTQETSKTEDNPEQLSFETLLFPKSEYGIIAEAQAKRNAENEIRARFRVYAPIFSLRLVHTDNLAYHGCNSGKVRSPQDASDLLQGLYKGLDREVFSVILLTTKNDVIGVNVVSVGDLKSAPVTPRETLKPAILCNAESIIVVHNHPSGDTTPSVEDLTVTMRLKDASEEMGIDLQDHIILGHNRQYLSLREQGFM